MRSQLAAKLRDDLQEQALALFQDNMTLLRAYLNESFWIIWITP